MGLQVAFVMATQSPFSTSDQQSIFKSTPASTSTDLNFLVFQNQNYVEATSTLAFPFGATKISDEAFQRKVEPLSLTETGNNKWTNSNGLNKNGFMAFDSDEDFGEFESVPAGGFSSDIGFKQRAVDDQHDRAYASLSSSHDSGRSKLVADDSFGFHSTSSPMGKQLFSVKSLQGQLDSFLPVEIEDDDWGDFVEHSAAANQSDVQPSAWLDDTGFSQAIHSTRNVKDGLLEVTTTKPTPAEKMTNAVPLAAELASPGYYELGAGEHSDVWQIVNRAGIDGLNTQPLARLDVPSTIAQGLAATSVPFQQPSLSPKMAIENKSSHNRKTSISEAISAPLPLSLFGEEELESEDWSLKCGAEAKDIATDGADHFSEGLLGNKIPNMGKSSPALASGVGNFSEIIASLYSTSDYGASIEAANNCSSFNTMNAGASGSPTLVDNLHRYLSDNNLICIDEDITERQLHNASQDASHNNISSQKRGLDEQLFELDLDLGMSSDFQSSCFCELCNVSKFSEHYSGPNEGIISRNVLSQNHANFGDVWATELHDSILSPESLNWDNFSLSLMEKGRIDEALACRIHVPALRHLFSMQVAKDKVAKPQEVHQWQQTKSMDFAFASSWMSTHESASIVAKMSCEEKLEACLHSLSELTLEQMANALGKTSSDVRAMVFQAEFQHEQFVLLANRDLRAAVELYAKAVTAFWVLGCASAQEQSLFLKAWATMASVCACELEHALSIWKQAHHDGIHLGLVANPQGRQFFAAIGQIYAVALILAAAATLYKPWLAVDLEEGKNLLSSLRRCKVAWVGTQLRDGVRLALHGMHDSMNSAVASWEEIEGLVRTVRAAAMQAGKIGAADKCSQPICGISLLPVLAVDAIPSVEWGGRCYLLPLANLWANRVSSEPPQLPSIKLGTISVS